MLERVAMHQTRMRLPGIGIDSKGVAVGNRGLVLLASLERLVAFLSLYSSGQPLSDLLGSLRIEVLRSKLNTREIALSFSATGSERIDSIAEVARLALGHTFTGTSRHFVQFRDAAAPFGYDAPQVLAADGDYILYHTMFTQTYEREREVDLRQLLLRLRPHQDPSAGREPGPTWLLAEEGLGPAVIHYLIRSGVKANVGVVQWPPESALDDASVRRYLFDLPDVPERMAPLFRTTPGLLAFRSVAPGVAVQIGFNHPITLRACPVFSDKGLVLFRGDTDPLVIEPVPTLGTVSAFARVSMDPETQVIVGVPLDSADLPQVRVPVKLMPSIETWHDVRGAYIAPEDYPILRRILYALGTETLRTATIAFTAQGALLLNPRGVESTPVGQFMRELRPGLFVAAGYEPVPAVDPEILHRSLGAPPDHVIFMRPGQAALGVARAAFVSLRVAMIEGQAWAPVDAMALEPALSTQLPRVVFDADLVAIRQLPEGHEGPGG